MPDIASMRGVKALEANHFGENVIVTATITPAMGANSTVTKVPNVNIHVALITHLLDTRTLLWVYSEAAGVRTITFGYDEHVGGGKIGHAALIAQATIAGEIRKIRGPTYFDGWSISNESGAWGRHGQQRRQVQHACRSGPDHDGSPGHCCLCRKSVFQVVSQAQASGDRPWQKTQDAVRTPAARRRGAASRNEKAPAGGAFKAFQDQLKIAWMLSGGEGGIRTHGTLRYA